MPRENSKQRELQGKAPRWDVLDVLCKDPKVMWWEQQGQGVEPAWLTLRERRVMWTGTQPGFSLRARGKGMMTLRRREWGQDSAA